MTNRAKYFWVENLFKDSLSIEQYHKIINFRLTANLNYLEGFVDKQKEQYFEPFLNLKSEGEVFVDVGGFDGFTTQQFIKRCPNYTGIYFFEPEDRNFHIAKTNLKDHSRIKFYDQGLSNEQAT